MLFRPSGAWHRQKNLVPGALLGEIAIAENRRRLVCHGGFRLLSECQPGGRRRKNKTRGDQQNCSKTEVTGETNAETTQSIFHTLNHADRGPPGGVRKLKSLHHAT